MSFEEANADAVLFAMRDLSRGKVNNISRERGKGKGEYRGKPPRKRSTQGPALFPLWDFIFA